VVREQRDRPLQTRLDAPLTGRWGASLRKAFRVCDDVTHVVAEAADPSTYDPHRMTEGGLTVRTTSARVGMMAIA